MADLVMGAMGSLVPKLGELLKEEYNLQTDVKERIRFLTRELESAQAALRKVSQVPWDQLDEQVKLWAREVRESSYDMEDVLDTFLVRVQGPGSAEKESSLKRLIGKISKIKARREISIGVKDIMSHLDEVTERCRRYKVEDIVATPAAASTIDPRLSAMYNKVKNLVGIDKPSGDLISMLQHHHPHQQDDVASNTKMMKIVSVVGVGGLGKTTLAKAVYDKLKGDFDRGAFVSVGRNPDSTKVIQEILVELDKKRYMEFKFGRFTKISQFINELRGFLLENKRYFIVIDDIWEIESWETIKLAIDDDNNCGGRIIITTRKLEIATKAADEVYKLQPLPCDSSRELFHTRIFGGERKYVDNRPDEVCDKILKKCGGIPLAIITMASLLVAKPSDKWSELYKSIGFGHKDNKDAAMAKILSFSYYDLPSHLRTCLLYFSAFPEDSFIPKHDLIWMWVAEGFVVEEQGTKLFEIGEGYFNDLINRSLIQAVESNNIHGSIAGCRVHDMVLDFIRSISSEENFLTVLDTNDQGRLLLSNTARRLAHHNWTTGQTHPANNSDAVLPRVRSFIARGCVIETWVSVSSFTLLRVLAIQGCKPRDGSSIRVEHLGRLLHLRYLSLINTRVDKISEEIGSLKLLQTLDLRQTFISELPLSFSLLSQLVCLHISFRPCGLRIEFSVERLTSLEELTVYGRSIVLKELGSLSELRVLQVFVHSYVEESEKDLVESLRHLHKLQHLDITVYRISCYIATWEATGFVLPRRLRHLALHGPIHFSKLPSCINPWSLPNLSHLDLNLEQLNEKDLKILGGLPKLRSLELRLLSSSAATISDIDSDSEAAGYFPKLRFFNVRSSMVLFLANKGDKSVSFHLWRGEDNIISMPFGSDDNDDELDSQRPIIPSVSDDDEFLQYRRLQDGLAALAYYYLLSFFQHVLAFVVKRWPFALISHRASGGPGNGELDDIAMPSASGSGDDENEGSICSKGAAAPPPRFMPSLQVLHFHVPRQAIQDHHRYCDNLGWEHLPSLQEIKVEIHGCQSVGIVETERVEAALRHAADVHSNRPTLRIERWLYA